MPKYLIDANLPYYFSLWNTADFSLKVLYKGTPPKVIHIRFGNLKIRDFHNTISSMWSIIERTIEECNLINVYIDKIEYVK